MFHPQHADCLENDIVKEEYMSFDEVMSYFIDRDLSDLEVFNFFDYVASYKSPYWRIKNTSVFLTKEMSALVFSSEKIDIFHKINSHHLFLFSHYKMKYPFSNSEREIIESFDVRDQKYLVRNIDLVDEMFALDDF